MTNATKRSIRSRAARALLAVFLGMAVWLAGAAGAVAQDRQAPSDMRPDVGGGQDSAAFREGLAAYEAGQPEVAFDIWTEAAAAGDPLAQYGLGKLYETGGPDFPADAVKAAEWYEQAAERGVPAALNNLARLFADGRGVARDTERAVLLWAQAAQLGHPHAQYNLGLALFRGEWVEQDRPGAVDWFLQAAAAGLPEAQFAAGQIFERGLHRQADAARAREWYRRAAEQGHVAAAESLERLDRDLAAAPAPPEPAPGAPQPEAEAEAPAPAQTAERPAATPAQEAPAETPPAPAGEAGARPAAERAMPPMPPRRPETAAQTAERAAGPSPEPAPSQAAPSQPAPSEPAQPEPAQPAAGEAAEPAEAPLVEAEAEPAPAVPQVASRVDIPNDRAVGGWRVWLGSAADAGEAERLAQELASGTGALNPDDIEVAATGDNLRLLAGRFDDRAEASELCRRLRIAAPAAFCIPIEE